MYIYRGSYECIILCFTMPIIKVESIVGRGDYVHIGELV